MTIPREVLLVGARKQLPMELTKTIFEMVKMVPTPSAEAFREASHNNDATFETMTVAPLSRANFRCRDCGEQLFPERLYTDSSFQLPRTSLWIRSDHTDAMYRLISTDEYCPPCAGPAWFDVLRIQGLVEDEA